MILVGNQRGGAKDLALHLMKAENERVEVHQLRGFLADDLEGAFQESYAISRGTRCKQFLFSLSLNPPKEADVSNEEFERAIEAAEAKLGLTDQPRAIVFHEKRGDDGEVRRHAHAVWSRIRVEEMKAVHLSKSHEKLQEVARDLYLEHGWTMPPGLARTGQRDPRNFTLAEWQQAKRLKANPREIKAAFQDAWAISDSKAALTHALQERGYWLARGDKRGFVALDHKGEVYALAKWAGVRTKAVRERLGDPETLLGVAETKAEIAKAMQAKMADFQREVAEREAREKAEAERKRAALKEQQRQERTAAAEAASQRQHQEAQARQDRLRTGIAGIWDRLRGERKRTLEHNRHEEALAKLRDKAERDKLTVQQLSQRRKAVTERARQRETNTATKRELSEDAQSFNRMAADARTQHAERLAAFKEKRRNPERRRRSRQRDPTMER